MSWSQISRFSALKNFQLKKCRLLLKVYSREQQYFLSCDCMLLPQTVSRSWFSLTAYSPGPVKSADTTSAVQSADKTWTVHGSDKTSAVHGADKTLAVHSADKTWAVHGGDKTSAVHGTDKSSAVHGADKTSAVHGADKTYAVQTIHRTPAVHSAVASGSLQIRNPMNLYLNVLPLCSSPWRTFSTSSTRTNKQNQLQSQDSAVSTDSAGVNSGEAKPETGLATDGSVKESDDAVKKLTLYQRFKKTYKEHGKILVAVHLLTSAVWFGSFYTVAHCGVDVVSFMEKLNFSEKIISPFRSGGLGDVAVAYLMYKLATPARYTVTIGGTNLAIRYLRKEGKIPHVPHEDRFRSLYREGKEHIKKRSRIHMRRLRKKHGIKSRFGHTKEKH